MQDSNSGAGGGRREGSRGEVRQGRGGLGAAGPRGQESWQENQRPYPRGRPRRCPRSDSAPSTGPAHTCRLCNGAGIDT